MVEVGGGDPLNRSGSATGWRVEEKKGNIAGVSVSVSGAGGYSKMAGRMSFSIRTLESSSTFKEIKKKYAIAGGIGAFFGWLKINAGASTHKEEVTRVFNELQKASAVEGTVVIDMYVTGKYPNVAVTASAFIMVFEVTDKSGSGTTFRVADDKDPNGDVGAQDPDGNKLPTKDQNNAIEF
jgi:hypothetical protein